MPDVDWSRVKSLIQVHGQLRSQEYHNLEEMAQAYAVAQRSKRLTEEGKEVPVSADEIRHIEAEADRFIDHETGENIIHRWYRDWQYFNERVIDMGFKAGILTEETAQTWREWADYFPFYRVAEGAKGEQFELGAKVFGGITGAVNLKKLKGGETPVNMPLVEATVMNLGAMIQMSMKNVAQQRVVRDMLDIGMAQMLKPGEDSPGTGRAKAPVVEFRAGGKKLRAAIFDPLLHDSLMPLDGTEVVSSIRNTLGLPATALRELITRDPGFIFITNLLRDSLSSYVTSGAKLTPVLSTVKGMTEGVETLETLGVAGGYDLSNDPKDLGKWFEKQLKRRGLSKDGSATGLNLFMRAWDGSPHHHLRCRFA